VTVSGTSQASTESTGPARTTGGASYDGSLPGSASGAPTTGRTTTDRSSEALLIAELRSGDPRAVPEFYHRYLDRVYNFVFHRVGGSVEDAEDVTQDTFISAFRSINQFRGDSAIFTWLCGIAKNKVRDFIRQKHRAKDIPPEQFVEFENQEALEAVMSDVWQRSLADQVVEQDAARAAVRDLFAGLSDDEREALWLRYVEELSVKEIAQLLGRTGKGVEGLLTRAKKKATGLAGVQEVTGRGTPVQSAVSW
jgi:RNA polymerase sigma-70 factor, ECF subfamily